MIIWKIAPRVICRTADREYHVVGMVDGRDVVVAVCNDLDEAERARDALVAMISGQAPPAGAGDALAHLVYDYISRLNEASPVSRHIANIMRGLLNAAGYGDAGP